ncbi:poly-beta-1,6-N-acetyl-D-glucosamine biosynthesis protein PgaD [Hydrogenophaga sp. BPS33]|uniref:poly-beta-1,6-N-acetyl-D-glucosamine biosynthesis protein PgaD n=1 Tax=Hydrogenophaga sp. BPS33 TaxID=2651974 RepID=UPI00131F994A|nr:poly-beta-1,6-N-acetyl-D-glucosamine biosynthesis protein PgaD [Hydrogenophaga sp. BPS33]QHE87503.1 poly-beta-1,6-N-acetyl-D-glucosamine biosynthesis protein PgaD [Hydrogenophaga sp. BPS33]
MIIKTSRSRLASFIDAVLTAIAWIAFSYLFGASLLNVLSGQREGGPDMTALTRLLPTMGTLSIYVVVALINAAILLTWARYNAYRFRGVDRRQASLPLNDAQLADRFGLSLKRRLSAAGARSMTIHHCKDGHIRGIDIHPDQAAALSDSSGPKNS